MPLTTQQQATLKAFVEGDVVLNAYPHTSDGAFAIANALQATASPEFVVWRTSVAQDEIMQNGFDWSRVDNLSVGKSRIWEWMFNNQSRTFNPAKANVRSGIDAVWVGTAADLLVRAAVYTHCKRAANLLEKLFAIGTGSTESPGTMAVEGSISYNDVAMAMGWSV